MKKANKYPVDWDDSNLYKSNDDPRMARDRKTTLKAHKEFAEKWKKNKDFMEKPDVLYEALLQFEELLKGRKSGSTEYYYWYKKRDVDSTNELYNRKYNEYVTFFEELENEIRFFQLNISKIKPKYQKKMLDSRKLKNYRHYLERRFRIGKYMLTEKEEKILALQQRPSFENWVDMTRKFYFDKEVRIINEKHQPITVPITEVGKYSRSIDEKVRSTAAKASYAHSAEIAPIATEEMNSVLQSLKIRDELRRYKRPDSKRLVTDDIDEKYVDTLIDAVTSNFDLSHRYFKLVAKMLGKRKINTYDMFVDLIPVKGGLKYDVAADTVIKNFSDVSKEFGKIAEEYIKNGRIDVYPKKGKRGGAYASTGDGVVPGYILLNFNEKKKDLLTLAHEMGHGLNHELYKKTQTPLNQGNSKAVAEVASTFFEGLILGNMVENAKSKKEVLSLKLEILEDFVGSVFRQIGFYQQEMEWHNLYRENSFVSEEELSEIYKKWTSNVVGPILKFPENYEKTWVKIIHFRLVFYVYSYTSGLLISKAFNKLLKEDPSFIEKMEFFFTQGYNISPSDLMQELGIDVYDKGFWELGLREFEEELNETEQLAEELLMI